MIYVVNGFPGSGKTTFEQYVEQICNPYCMIISTIDFVKKVAISCGWDRTKTPKNRKFLSDLKDLLTEWNDVPLKVVSSEVDRFVDQWIHIGHDSVVFIDCREPEEIGRICKQYGAKSILVTRGPDMAPEASNHADKEVLNYNYDIIITNDGSLADLALTAIEFVEKEHLPTSQNLTQLQLDFFDGFKVE